ncbi:RHS repeat domain-containing protein [Sorangium sp. So ce216]
MTRIFRNARGNPEHIANPLGQTTTYRHDELGLLRERIDPNGARTSYQHDAQGNLTAVASPNGAVWRFQYL